MAFNGKWTYVVNGQRIESGSITDVTATNTFNMMQSGNKLQLLSLGGDNYGIGTLFCFRDLVTLNLQLQLSPTYNINVTVYPICGPNQLIGYYDGTFGSALESGSIVITRTC